MGVLSKAVQEDISGGRTNNSCLTRGSQESGASMPVVGNFFTFPSGELHAWLFWRVHGRPYCSYCAALAVRLSPSVAVVPILHPNTHIHCIGSQPFASVPLGSSSLPQLHSALCQQSPVLPSALQAPLTALGCLLLLLLQNHSFIRHPGKCCFCQREQSGRDVPLSTPGFAATLGFWPAELLWKQQNSTVQI